MFHYIAPVLALAFATATAFESKTIEDAARDFRIQTYDTFRLNRDEYNRRRKIGDDATHRLEAADEQQQQALASWFVQSTIATRNGRSLPPLPNDEYPATEQLAEDAVSVAVDSITENARRAEQDKQVLSSKTVSNRSESVTRGANPSAGTLPTADVDGEYGDDASYKTSIVKTDKLGLQPKSRTFSILGSVGRAVTNAVAAGVDKETNSDQEPTSTVFNVDQTSDKPTSKNPVPAETESTEAPTPAEVDDKSLDFSEEDFELEDLLRESPAAEEPLEPTPETFQRESRWQQGSTLRFAQRVEKLDKAIHRVALRLDMPGMSVEQIEGAVELAEDMCWHYKTLATYLNATGGDDSVVHTEAIRAQLARLQARLDKGLSTYRAAVEDNPSISRHIVKLEELVLRAQLLRGEVDAAV